MSSYFSKVTLKLLAGEIIDEVTAKPLMDWLNSDNNWQDVCDYLAKIERQPLFTKDKSGVYLGFLDVNQKEHNRVIRQRFEQLGLKLYPLILWLRLSRSCMSMSRPLQAGDLLKEADLLNSIEDSKQLQHQLDEIITKLGRTSKEPKKQITSLLDYLQSEGFLHPVGSTGAVYKATAKWSLLYDQLEYINKYQVIVVEEEVQSALDFDSQAESSPLLTQ